MEKDESPSKEEEERSKMSSQDAKAEDESGDERKVRVYGKMVEALLMPDENGMVRKERLVEFFQKTIGTMFSGDKASEVLEALDCDGNNLVRLECFLKAFAEKYCTAETLTGIVELLERQPDSMEFAWDWKGMLSQIGLELTDTDLKEAVQAAKNLAEMLLEQQKEVNPESESPSGGDGESGQILEAVKDSLHLMGLGEGPTSPGGEADH